MDLQVCRPQKGWNVVPLSHLRRGFCLGFVHLQTHGPQSNNVTFSLALPPPPHAVFLGYTLPPGHPCNLFTLPPPPADKKRTGPRRKFLLFIFFCNSRPYLSNDVMLMMLLSFLRSVQFSLSSMLPSCGGSHSLDAKGPFRLSCS